MKNPRYEIGMVGLGVMGRNLILNIAEHGFPVAGYDMDPAKVEALRRAAGTHEILAVPGPVELAAVLRRPRAVMLLVPANAVDAVIADLLPYLTPGDLLVDGGNSFFRDTEQRATKLAKKGIDYLGVGISGGEAGARHGPSIMPGGAKSAYERIRPILEAAASKVDGEACVTYLGSGASGHFVKMVHNGIEYGLMQLISECYDLMKRGLEFDDDRLQQVFDAWNHSQLDGYLMEITARIFARTDETTGERLIDEILDVASQKGTGMWTSESAMELQVPVPTIDLAVGIRNLSGYEEQRRLASAILRRPPQQFAGDKETAIADLHDALYAATIITYAQGAALLATASQEYGYHLDLEAVARIWRGGCIIRSGLLEDIRSAFRAQPDLPNLLLDDHLSQQVLASQEALRRVVCMAVQLGLPALGLMSALGYLDGFRSAWLPTNLIQAQRDYFGAHTYHRIDAPGTFHTEWEKG